MMFLAAVAFASTVLFAQQGAPEVIKKSTGGKTTMPASTSATAVTPAKVTAPTEPTVVKKTKKVKKAVKKAQTNK